MAQQKISIEVAGMSCSHCENTVRNLITDERGVKKIEINSTTGEVEIWGTEKMNKNQIIGAVNLSGMYSAK